MKNSRSRAGVSEQVRDGATRKPTKLITKSLHVTLYYLNRNGDRLWITPLPPTAFPSQCTLLLLFLLLSDTKRTGGIKEVHVPSTVTVHSLLHASLVNFQVGEHLFSVHAFHSGLN